MGNLNIDSTGAFPQLHHRVALAHRHGRSVAYLCVEHGQGFGRVQRDEHLHEELLVLGLQGQREAVDDTDNRETTGQSEKCEDRLDPGRERERGFTAVVVKSR